MFDSAGKYGAGLALEELGLCLEELGVEPDKVPYIPFRLSEAFLRLYLDSVHDAAFPVQRVRFTVPPQQ